MTDEQVIEAWDAESPIATVELAKVEGTLRGIACVLEEVAGLLTEIQPDDMRFYATEVRLMSQKIQKIRESLYP